MGELELNRVSSVNKKIQVEMKHKTKRDKKTKRASSQQHNAESRTHRDSLQHHEAEDRKRQSRSPSLHNINSANSSLEEEYNRMFLRHQQNDALGIRKHNSDISDFITIMAMEDNLQSMRDEAVPSEGDDSRRLRASESDLKAIMSGTCKNACCGNRTDYTDPTLDLYDLDCTYNRVKEMLRQDLKGWEQQCACTSRKKCDGVKRKSSPWEKSNEIFSCDRTCSNKQKSQRGWKGQRKLAQVPSCCCNDPCSPPPCRPPPCRPPLRKESERKIDSFCDPREPPPCVKCCSGSKVQVYQESDTGTAARSLSGAGQGQGCSSNTCPPCQLCQQGCAALKLSPSEEKIALERDMARCDCKRKLLRLRLMRAFNVCAKCRLPRTMCRCLEEIIREYRRREVEKEIELKRKAQQNGIECTCEGDDPFAKLIHEVTNTCPKCGHWRNDCTCLEEMIIDVKRLMLKKSPQYGNGNDSQPGGKSCKCISQGRRSSSRQNSMYQTTNVGNVSCSKCEGISIEVDCPLPEDDSVMCAAKDQNMYNSSKTCINVHVSKISPLQYSPSPQVQSNESKDTDPDVCSVCKKRVDLCDCNAPSFVKCNLDSVNTGQSGSDTQERKREKDANPETKEEFCECVEEAVDESGRVRMCEECLRPKIHCVCKQSPTCYKCGKYKCEDSEICTRHQAKYGSERPRSRTRHRHSESVRTAPNINTHYERHRQPSESRRIECRREDQASKQSTEETGPRCLPKTKTCEERCSQSAFQKLKSHFRRCNSCGKKHAKKSNESKQVQCERESKAEVKETTDNGKSSKKSRKPDEKGVFNEPEEIPLTPKRSLSMKRHRHHASEK